MRSLPAGVIARAMAAVLLVGIIRPLATPPSASATIVTGNVSIGGNTPTVEVASPNVSAAEVAAGAILVAQIVAVGDGSVSNVWICPSAMSGWTHIERVVDSSGASDFADIVQQLWWRPVTAPQSPYTAYTFKARPGNCITSTTESVAITVALTVYSGVDTSAPIDAVESATGETQRTIKASAPATTLTHKAGSRVVRYAGINTNKNITANLDDASSRYYNANTSMGQRSVAAFETTLESAMPALPLDISFAGLSRWIATTVVLKEPGGPTEPDDTTPPTTTASGAYVAGSWTNGNVNVSLSATDIGGAGVNEIVYSASGDQTIGETTVPGATANVEISAEGTTTVKYYARDGKGNTEGEQSFVAKIDKTPPSLSGAASSAPNAAGWYNHDVTVNWSCADALSGLANACPANSVITGEGDNLSASASLSDNAENQTTSSVNGIRIDQTPPVTSIAPVPPWNNESVTVDFTANDNLSGVAVTSFSIDDGPQQSGTSTTFTADGVYTLSYWSVDVAGNVEGQQTVTVQIDTVAPEISISLSEEPNANGWHNAPVTVTFVCEDKLSSIKSCTVPQTLSSDGVSQAVTGTAVDNAGNSAAVVATVSIDQIAPTIVATRTPDTNDAGWNNTSVNVTFECHDATSGIDVCPSLQTVGEGASQTVNGEATDAAGNTSSATVDTINVDLTPPTITATATTADGATYVAGTWTNQKVTVTFQCSDALSGVVECPTAQTFSDSVAQSATGTVWDIAGNRATVTFSNINVDPMPPSIGASLTTADGQQYVVGNWARQSVTVTFACSDTLTDVTCSASQTLAEGAGQSVTGTTTDAAGNSASLTVEPINVDLTIPNIAAAATTADGQPYVSGTWTNQSVSVSFACADLLSGLTSTCPATVVVETSTAVAGQSVAAAVSDLAGNQAMSAAVIVKVDKDAPVFTVVPTDVQVDVPDGTSVTVSWPAPEASDAIGGLLTPDCTATPGAWFPLGETTVTCTATDQAGNSTTLQFTVTVSDTTPPPLNVPDDITVAANSPAGALVTWDASSSASKAALSATEIQAVCTPSSGSLFPVGTTPVTCSATDLAGNIATANFTVTVVGAKDLLTSLHADTSDLVVHPFAARVLLHSLDIAHMALDTGRTLLAYVVMIRYTLLVNWFARIGWLTPQALNELQLHAREVIDAMW